MKDSAQAQRLLRAMSEIDEKFFLEAQSSPKRRASPLPRLLALAACLTLVIAGSLLLFPRQGSEAYPTELVGNPIQEAANMTEAEAITGFGLELPEAQSPYSSLTLTVIDGTLIEASYCDESGEEGYSIRKAPGTEDISGDYNSYPESQTLEIGGRTVTAKGSGGTVSTATWTQNGYTYALNTQAHPLTTEEATALIQAIDP